MGTIADEGEGATAVSQRREELQMVGARTFEHWLAEKALQVSVKWHWLAEKALQVSEECRWLAEKALQVSLYYYYDLTSE